MAVLEPECLVVGFISSKEWSAPRNNSEKRRKSVTNWTSFPLDTSALLSGPHSFHSGGTNHLKHTALLTPIVLPLPVIIVTQINDPVVVKPGIASMMERNPRPPPGRNDSVNVIVFRWSKLFQLSKGRKGLKRFAASTLPW